MRPPSFLASLLLCLPLAAGCRPPGGQAEDVAALASRIRFGRTTEPQGAVFLTQQAPFVGGPAAGAIYLKPSENARVEVNGQAVMIPSAAHRALLGKLPRPAPKGADFILVEARVRLEKMSGTVTTNPPQSQSYLGVVFEEVKRVEWYVPPRVTP